MSTHSHTVHLPVPERLVPSRFPITGIFGLLSIVGLILSGVGYAVDREQFAYSWFFAFYYFLTIALGSFFWVALHYACDSDWTVLVRRTWENIIGLFLLLAILMIPILLPGTSEILWKWMSPEHINDPELARRSAYLNGQFFFLRYVFYFLFFGVAGWYFRGNSIAQDSDGNPVHSRHCHKWSYLALVFFFVLETFIGVDWFMGLDWKWSSSLFGCYNGAVCIQSSMAAGIVLIALLRAGGFLLTLNSEHFHLMGKLLFGFTILWAYFAFGQYLLCWYANIPEETIFYNNHNRGDWWILSYFLIVGKFMFPVIYLLAQDVKKSLKGLVFIAGWILFMHGVELYWFIMPFAHPHTLLPSWLDFVTIGTFTSILGFFYIKLAASASLFPTRDPRLVECLTIVN